MHDTIFVDLMLSCHIWRRLSRYRTVSSPEPNAGSAEAS